MSAAGLLLLPSIQRNAQRNDEFFTRFGMAALSARREEQRVTLHWALLSLIATVHAQAPAPAPGTSANFCLVRTRPAHTPPKNNCIARQAPRRLSAAIQAQHRQQACKGVGEAASLSLYISNLLTRPSPINRVSMTAVCALVPYTCPELVYKADASHVAMLQASPAL